jgi:hypothetical protein
MQTAGRLLAIVVTALVIAAVPAPAGERTNPRVAAPYEGARVSPPRDGASIEPRGRVPAPPTHALQSQASQHHAERDKRLAWLLLLLKEQKGAR